MLLSAVVFPDVGTLTCGVEGRVWPAHGLVFKMINEL